MGDVRNWQIGRKMPFPLPERHPKAQFAFVFNANRCTGCQSCAQACKSAWTPEAGQETMWWSNVESKPYGSYPRGWDVKLLEMLERAAGGAGLIWADGVYEGPTVFEAGPLEDRAALPALGYLPTDADWRAPNPYEDAALPYPGGALGISLTGATRPQHRTWSFHLQRMCNHCSFAACEAACPTGAISKRPEDGVVVIDPAKCRGHRKCMEACPYKKAMYRPTTGKAELCHGCLPKLGAGEQSACASACPDRTLLQGLVKVGPDGDWVEDRWNPVYFLVKVAKVALPLYPQFGTQPHGYYLPPTWVPLDYLRQLFGPGADEAVKRLAAPDDDLRAALQLFGRSTRMITRYEAKGPAGVVAYGNDGAELFRATEEPLHVRSENRPGDA